MVIAFLLACAGPDDAGSPPSAVVALDGPRLARRMSLDLRGVLPTVQELDAVEADASMLPDLRDAWLETPEFEARLVELYQESWGTRADQFRGTITDFDLDAEEEYAFVRAVGEEPLRLAARVVADDRSYTELMTADWTMANEMLAEVFPIDRPSGESGWVPASYTDLRPAAGVLTTNGLWWRYISPINNFNRGRTAAILNLFVCVDLLSRPVEFSAAIATDPDEAQAAVRTDPACLACHATVEPVAATLFGFMPLDDQSALEMSTYHPEREHDGEEQLGVQPAWYGRPIDGLADLGAAIAADDRFVDCGVSTLAEGLLRRPVDAADAPTLRAAREAFVEHGLRLKAAVRVLTDSEAYRGGGFLDAATAEQVELHSTRRILVSSQLRSVLGDFAGLDWVRGGAELLDWDTSGFRMLGGGVDGELLGAPQRTPGLTWALLVRRAAEVAATSIVDHDLAEGGSPRVLTRVTASSRPADPAFVAQLEELHWRLFACRADAGTLSELSSLWEEAAAAASPEEAWGTVLAVLLRDPAFVAY
jgi:hypothetical protein